MKEKIRKAKIRKAKSMKAQEIINKAPKKPEMTASVEDYRTKYSQYQKAQSLYKTNIMLKLKGQKENVWLALLNEFRGIDQNSGAIKVMVTSWTNSIRDAFARENLGREIRPVKNGTQIVGYVVSDITNELTEKKVAQIMEIVAEYPGLFISDISKERVNKLVEFTEKNAATIAVYKSRKARLESELKLAKEELASAQVTADEVEECGDKPGKGLAGRLNKAQTMVAALQKQVAEPMAALN